MNVFRLNLIIVCIVVGSAAAFTWGLLLPGFGQLHERQGLIQGKLKGVQQAQLEIGNVTDLYASILNLHERMSSFHERLPTERRLGEFLNDVTQCLEQGELLDYTIQPKPVRRVDPQKLPDELKLTKGTVILPVHLSFNATLSQVYDFLHCLNSLVRLSHIDTLNMSNDERRPGRLNVDLLLQTYYRPKEHKTEPSPPENRSDR